MIAFTEQQACFWSYSNFLEMFFFVVISFYMSQQLSDPSSLLEIVFLSRSDNNTILVYSILTCILSYFLDESCTIDYF